MKKTILNDVAIS